MKLMGWMQRDSKMDRLAAGVALIGITELVAILVIVRLRPLYADPGLGDLMPASRLLEWPPAMALLTMTLLAVLVRQRVVFYIAAVGYAAWWIADVVVLSSKEYGLPSDMPWFPAAPLYGIPLALLAGVLSWAPWLIHRLICAVTVGAKG